MRRFMGAVAVAGTVLVFLSFSLPAYAAAGDLDPTFGVGGKVTTEFSTRQGRVNTVAWQTDGKLVSAGESGASGSNPKLALARYDADGSLDTTFGGDGEVTTDFTSKEDYALAVAIQSDGKIVAVGESGAGGSNPKFALARYNADGSLDTSFDADGKLTTDFSQGEDLAWTVAVQPDGKIVAGGDALGHNPTWALARYNTDGSLDTTFGGDGTVTTDFTSYPEDLLALAIQPDGMILAAGGSGFGDPNENFVLARYGADGSLDMSFGADGKVTTSFTRHPDVAFAMGLQADGKIVVAGQASLAVRPTFALARYNPDGSLDSSFGQDGKVTTDFTPGGDDGAYTMTFQADGKIVAAGQAGGKNFNWKFAVVRYNTDGSLDTSFGGDGKVTTDFTDGYEAAYGVAIEADGKIVAAGPSGCCPPEVAVARYLAA